LAFKTATVALVSLELEAVSATDPLIEYEFCAKTETVLKQSIISAGIVIFIRLFMKTKV
jgi:hypothetical protein